MLFAGHRRNQRAEEGTRKQGHAALLVSLGMLVVISVTACTDGGGAPAPAATSTSTATPKPAGTSQPMVVPTPTTDPTPTVPGVVASRPEPTPTATPVGPTTPRRAPTAAPTATPTPAPTVPIATLLERPVRSCLDQLIPARATNVPALLVGYPNATLIDVDGDTSDWLGRLVTREEPSSELPEPGFVDLSLQNLHATRDIAQFGKYGLQAIGSQVQFLDQPHGLVAAIDESMPGVAPLRFGAAAADRDVVVDTVLPQQMAQRRQIRPQPSHDVPLLGGVGHRDFDGAVQPQSAVPHFFQGTDSTF